MENTYVNSTGKIEIIQVIRLYAALCVMIYHSGLVGENGYFAVEIFNIISGFIMVYSTERENSKEFFLRKRLIRIVPLYWILSIVMYIFIVVDPGLSIMSEAKPVYLVKSLLFLPFVNGKGYNAPILSLGWTLNYEMMFYVIFFIAIHLNHKLRALWASIIITGFVFLGRILHFNGNIYWNYYTDIYMLEFVLGILSFYVIRWARMKMKWKYRNVLYGCLIAVSVIWMSCNVGVTCGFHRCFQLGIPAAIFFTGSVLCCERRKFPVALVKLGDVSFSIYLLEYFSTAFFKTITGQWTFVSKIAIFFIIMVVTLIASMISYELIEMVLTSILKKKFCSRD